MANAQLDRLYQGFDNNFGERLQESTPLSASLLADNTLLLQVDSHRSHGQWDITRLEDSVLACIAQGHYGNGLTYAVRPPTDIISIRMVISGRILLGDKKDNALAVQCGVATASLVHAGHDQELHISGDNPLASFTLHVHRDRLPALLNLHIDQLPQPLRELDNGSCLTTMTPCMTKGVLDLMQMPCHGLLRLRYLQSKSMELLCLFVSSLQHEHGESTRIPARKHVLARIRKAQAVLEENFSAPPSVNELARLLGLNRTQLRSEFKRIHGMTIADFLESRRMMAARELLADANLSIAAVANAVGYRHQSNFATAFRRHFGMTPRTLRGG
ncbi:MAG: AraC family transcriptional regulator [Pseudomonadota bacterium]|nr:AraC family transcriptional regulator [Pseudomonadota bacterium]